MCVPALRLLITSGMMWSDMHPYDWLNKFYSCYMTTVVIVVNVVDMALAHILDTNPIRVR